MYFQETINMKKLPLLAALLTVAAALAVVSVVQAAHPGGPVTLKDKDGNAIVTGTNTPYSPKQTCAASCHNYESDVALATKDHGPGTTPYQAPYPQHGVTAGYHFQQGRNLTWGDVQREFYHLAEFTSSGGMAGKY